MYAYWNFSTKYSSKAFSNTVSSEIDLKAFFISFGIIHLAEAGGYESITHWRVVPFTNKLVTDVSSEAIESMLASTRR